MTLPIFTASTPTFIQTTQCEFGSDCAAPGIQHLKTPYKPATPASEAEKLPCPYLYPLDLITTAHEREQLRQRFNQTVNRERWAHIFNERVKGKK
jgi:hypothetical protein